MLFTSSKSFSSSKNKLSKSSHATTELIVRLIVNLKEHLIRVLADTIATNSSIILEAYTSDPFIKTYDSNTIAWITIGGDRTATKIGLVTVSLLEFNLKKQMYSSWAFHVDDRSESTSTYDMIIGDWPRSA
jgi:hypothetical protein